MREEWRDVKGFEDIYQVSNLGRVKSLSRRNKRGHLRKERIMKETLNCRGYKYVVLQDGRSRVVHRIVLEAFLNESGEGLEANHKNGAKTDNRLENLEWVTHQENMIHAIRKGLRNTPKGQCNHNSKLTNSEAFFIRELYKKEGQTKTQLAKRFNVSLNAISRVLKNETYKQEVI